MSRGLRELFQSGFAASVPATPLIDATMYSDTPQPVSQVAGRLNGWKLLIELKEHLLRHVLSYRPVL
jgi:hypothetical protein